MPLGNTVCSILLYIPYNSFQLNLTWLNSLLSREEKLVLGRVLFLSSAIIYFIFLVLEIQTGMGQFWVGMTLW